MISILALTFMYMKDKQNKINHKAYDSGRAVKDRQINFKEASSFLRLHYKYNYKPGLKQILIFVDISDLNCYPCLESLVNTCKYLTKRKKTENNDVVILFKKRHENENYYSWFINNWCKENDILFPTVLDENNVFQKANISKTSIAIFSDDLNIVEYKEFPIQDAEMKRIVNKI